MKGAKATLLDDPMLSGRTYCNAHAAAADVFFKDLMDQATDDHEGVALVAVGGYGRRVLWPYSDLDVMLIHTKKRVVSTLAEALWYPVWDRGLKLGHTVATVDQVMDGAGDLDRATALLDARLIVGDPSLVEKLQQQTAKLWDKKSDELLMTMARSVESRHHAVGDVAFRIEPELKNGRGGLRDLHALRWAERAEPGFASDFIEELSPQSEALLSARVELHRTTGRPGDTLTLDDQDAVAEALGDENGQALMLRLALAARRVAWHSDEAWDRWQRARSRPRRGRPVVPLSEQFELRDEQVELRSEVQPADDPLIILRAAELAARTGTTIGTETLESLQRDGQKPSEPWPQEARDLFAGVFLAGPSAIGVVEDLDQFELMVRVLPEWETVRCKPQRNVLHTYTVDRHLCEAAVNAAALADRVDRPDLLVIGALFHDIGKGYPGDHTIVGMEVIETIAGRMGFTLEESAVLVDLCRYHLLLSDVAVRRDISDPGTIRSVAAAVDTVPFLHLLAALSEADSIATSPAVWNSWKAELLRELVERTAHVIEGGSLDEVTPEFPTAELRQAMAVGERMIRGSRDRLTVVAADEPGLFYRIAGVLAMNGLEVVDASAYSDQDMACSQFVVNSSATKGVDWNKVADEAARALDGGIALSARVNARADMYGRYQRRLSAEPVTFRINVDNSISDAATVVDVHAPDTIGLLFRITRALVELKLDIRSISAQTLGPEAVDSFYLCDHRGRKLEDPDVLAELELAIRNAMGDEIHE